MAAITAALCNAIFNQSIEHYHLLDQVDQQWTNPYQDGGISALLFRKNWIDTVQWHLEDIIRSQEIRPEEGMVIKRRIDASNQERTDVVEKIDDWFLSRFAGVEVKDGARLNTESPAWVVDRLSILALKVYHMQEQAIRVEASPDHREKCRAKLQVLLAQQADLSGSFDELLADYQQGTRYIKVYRQMKMYNDASLNPALYNQQTK